MSAGKTAFDVVVVGGGIAGLMAANRAAELGARVCVLERQSEQRYLCNTRLSGGTFHVAFRNIEADEETLATAIATASHGFADPALSRIIARDGKRAIAWLESEGVAFTAMGEEEWQRRVLAPRITSWRDGGWEGKGGDALLARLESNLRARGGVFRRGWRAVELLQDADGVAGVVALQADGARSPLAARSVVLADGGFQGDADLMRAFVSPDPARLKQRGAAAAIGDGIKMACALGASTIGMGGFYGHLLSRDAMTSDRLWPFPVVDFLGCAGIIVNRAGRRFVDEGLGGVFAANAVAALANPLEACIIFDEATWQGPGRHFVRAPNPTLIENGATLHKADRLVDLAQVAGIDAEALAQTVTGHNDAVDRGVFSALTPPRTADWKGFDRAGDKYRPRPIRTAPFYALQICAGVTFTTGGLAIDTDARVLRDDGAPIPRLYAAGANIGGIEGGPRCGYIGGLAKDAVFALRAGTHAARSWASLEQSRRRTG